MKSDFQISNECEKKHIADVAAKLGINSEDLILYGNHKAKIQTKNIKKDIREDANLVLVTSINPTSSGEGKSTVTIGLSDALNRIGKKSCVALREPSLGPVLGRKGGAAGGGYAQVVPMEDINLHFTGDMHAITTAHNAIAVLVNNHVFQGNELEIDKIVFNRVMDMNARDLRHIKINAGTDLERNDGFDITVASEIMAILCLSESLGDLKEKLKNILVAYNKKGEPVYVKDLKIEGVITSLLKDAIKPNIVQTLENNPAIIHGGPFANIAHGCNSVRATKIAMGMADIALTEAGFGADLGAEKFFDIKCRKAGIAPDCVVLVATVRALKYNGGVAKDELSKENLEALKKGIVNLEKHIENIKLFGVPVVVTLNHFVTDSEAEVNFIKEFCESRNCEFAISKVWEEGGKGGVELAKKILYTLENKESHFTPLYPDDMSIEDKLYTIATKIYGAKNVTYSPAAKKAIEKAKALGYGNLPVCVAKNQYSLSDDPKKLGRPENFDINVREAYVNAGAGFVVAITGSIMTMPGLPKVPAAEAVDVDENGNIVGLF